MPIDTERKRIAKLDKYTQWQQEWQLKMTALGKGKPSWLVQPTLEDDDDIRMEV